MFMEESEKENKEHWTIWKMLRGHLEDVYDLCWSPCSQFLFTGAVDNTAILWDVTKGGAFYSFLFIFVYIFFSKLSSFIRIIWLLAHHESECHHSIASWFSKQTYIFLFAFSNLRLY